MVNIAVLLFRRVVLPRVYNPKPQKFRSVKAGFIKRVSFLLNGDDGHRSRSGSKMIIFISPQKLAKAA
jgi:hypothetical protein